MATSAPENGDVYKAHMSLAFVQICYGGYHVITKVALNVGVNQLVFCVFRDLLAVSILAPVAYVREKHTRPPITRHLLLSFFFLGFTGIFANQLLFLIGLSYTNPSYAAAVQPAIPVFTFILTVIMGTEKVNIFRADGQAKVAGTFVCVSGAMLMVIYQGPALFGYSGIDYVAQSDISAIGQPERSGWLKSSFQDHLGFDNFQLGVICLIGNCICMAAFISIQARVLKKYPANLSLTAYSYLSGTAFMLATAFFLATDLKDWSLTRSELIAVVYAGSISSALSYGLLIWSNKILGPALVALYYPLQPLASSCLSRIFLGSRIYLGSVLGGSLIIGGLYLVTWASFKERQVAVGVIPQASGPSESEPLIAPTDSIHKT